MAQRNRYKVQKRMWRKWSQAARKVFNDTHFQMINSQWIFTHPQADKISREHWKTIAWNAAWTAAEAVRDYEKEQKNALSKR